MCPSILVHVKDLDNSIRRRNYDIVHCLFAKFEGDIIAHIKNRNVHIITDAVVKPSDKPIPFFYNLYDRLVSRWNEIVICRHANVLYILPTRLLRNTNGIFQSVGRCEFDAKNGYFVGEIGRNKNKRIISKKTLRKQTCKPGKYLKPRKNKSLTRPVLSLKRYRHKSEIKLQSRDEFRVGKENDERFSLASLYPLNGQLYRVDNTPFPVQVSDSQDELRSEAAYSVVEQHSNYGAEHHNNDLATDEARAHSSIPARYPDYEILQRRQESFSSWPHSEEIQDRSNMAKWGLFYIGPFDLVRCYQCGIGLKDWSYADDPLYEHIRYSPQCQHLEKTIDPQLLRQYRSFYPQNPSEGQSTLTESTVPSGNIPVSAAVEPYRNPEYSSFNVRVSSFSNWPRDIVQTPEQLAEAGFFYTGMQDVVRCFACDGGLQRWDPNDDPWVEHAHWFPNCAHVRQIKGEEYINLIRLAIDHESENEDEAGVIAQGLNELQIHNNNSNGRQHQNKESEDPAAQSVIGFGYSRAAVKMAIDECNDKGIRWKAEDLLNVLLDKEDRSEVLPTDSPRPESPELQLHVDQSTKDGLLQERSILLSRLKCIMCEKNDINVLFLPCAHHKMCLDCVKDVTMCPICGKTIREKVKTFMS